MSYIIRIEEATITLNPDTFCPQKRLPIDLSIQYEAQHDGKSWSDEYVANMEQDLYEDIMHELGDIVREHIKQTKPFACHQFKESNEKLM